MLFKENADTIEEKPFDKWVPLTRGPFGYSIARSVAHQELFGEILVLCDKARIPLIALHFETGPGVIEASLHYCVAGGRGSSIAFKSMIKAWAQTRGMMATFMAKVSEKWPGRSGHIHISVASDGDNAFHDRDRFRSISKQMSQFIGRQLKYMSVFCVLAAPNFNSYKRLVPGCWAPACPIGADMNPYLALSCAIGSGILGIEEDAALRASIVGDASEKTCHTSARLPQST
ncbi:glutamine synthetase [Bradyrhizobium barranii subsp. apii]|uniref:Glutamine synthetase n=1 Tax=Bradyrhizobium barranii subsp. apii TaxID=2819348 RepID=A0A8U0FQ38_9BRAD|nr:glutamine synthetase [Bradyrhizobium barranii]UPT88747.1 glutamine synthetase [Bradyrhizobium barranii subsp. apii]UPT97329.1 glutamine synthetase [Bradyrhizobium barranii subsp. apii]